MKRREFNKSLIAVAGISAVGTMPISAIAAWPESAFDADSTDAVANILFGTTETIASDAITIKAPDIAENGAVVPISVSADIPNADSVAILVSKNPSPLAASFELANAGKVNVGTRIKMGQTSELVALVRADGKVYTATSKEVKVTIGGCGG